MVVTPRRLAVALLALAPLVAVSCGGSDKVAERIAEEAIERETGGSVDIDTDGGSVSVETDDGSFSMGQGSVPDGWPDDIPLPDGLEVLAGSEITQDDGVYVTITGNVDATAAELGEFYKEELSDWKVVGEATNTMNGVESVMLQMELDLRGFTMNVSSGGDEPTTLTISHITRTP